MILLAALLCNYGRGKCLIDIGTEGITRRNLSVQPTIKVPPGYKFTVRVNRDILFEALYSPVQVQDRQPQRAPAK